jgi:hypothetical protein
LQSEQAAGWSVIARLRERNADRGPDEAVADATLAVAEARDERRER